MNKSSEKKELRSSNGSPRSDFDILVENSIYRRDFIHGIITFGGIAFLTNCAETSESSKKNSSKFTFKQIKASTADTVTVPEGYKVDVVVSWGDPLWTKAPEFDPVTRGTALSQELAFGDNNDGQDIFHHSGHVILVVNNETTNRKIIWGNRPDSKPVTSDDIKKGMMAHGVTIMEIKSSNGKWGLLKDSPYNRRITPETKMLITGPAAAHSLMKTAEDPTGTIAKGTWNNCGSGRTPWGTYLTCEENFHKYFSSKKKNHKVPENLRRYGIRRRDKGYKWADIDERFDIAKNPNEANRVGYVVEIDPTNPKSIPRKLTALGRLQHENAEVVVSKDGHLVVYMGDDERGEFIYRFISEGKYNPNSAKNSFLLEKGFLFAAKFNVDGSGKWLPLTPKTTGFASEAEICINTRQAGSAVGATTMDRPEWIALNPTKPELYCALTNNKGRGLKPNEGGDTTPVIGPNPRKRNEYGQIVRWWPKNADHTSDDFTWDLFVLAGNPVVHNNSFAGSSNIDRGNMFNSPDGIKFDQSGHLWIQTDGNYSNKGAFRGQGNNQMLVGDPKTGEIVRFLVGPKECSISGLSWSPDRRSMFVGIQNPGKRGGGHWPEGGTSVARSSIIAVSRIDGGKII